MQLDTCHSGDDSQCYRATGSCRLLFRLGRHSANCNDGVYFLARPTRRVKSTRFLVHASISAARHHASPSNVWHILHCKEEAYHRFVIDSADELDNQENIG